MKNFLMACCAVMAAVLAGCVGVDVPVRGTVDLRDKTVCVSERGKFLTVDLKNALRRDGWQVTVSNEPVRGVRYRLVDTWTSAGEVMVQHFDIRLVDIETGKDVVRLKGHGKRSREIVKIFIRALHGEDYDGWDRR